MPGNFVTDVDVGVDVVLMRGRAFVSWGDWAGDGDGDGVVGLTQTVAMDVSDEVERVVVVVVVVVIVVVAEVGRVDEVGRGVAGVVMAGLVEVAGWVVAVCAAAAEVRGCR